MAAAFSASADPIDRLVANLSASHGMWRNGLMHDLPLTISTSPAKKGRERPYHDSLTPEGMLDYCYTPY